MKTIYQTGAMVVLILLCAGVSYAMNPPICPHVIGWNSQIASWAQGCPWIKVIYSTDVAPAKAIGSKVFYRPWDADSANHDDGCLPASLTGSQYADLVWAKISPMTQKPDAVGYRNEFNWDDPTCSKRTCAEFVNYKNRLRELGYTGKIIFGSFGVGWVDENTWNDPDLVAAATAADGIETHEYFDLDVNCGAPWLCFRHRDLAINVHPYLQSKEWYIGEFGSDRCYASSGACGDSVKQRRGWNDNGKLTEQQYITQMAAYRAGCADNVKAVFVFQQGDTGPWADFEVMGTNVAYWMRSTWGLPFGRFAGTTKTSTGSTLGYVDITITPGLFAAKSSIGGIYSISNLPAGTYSITASKVGYAQTTLTNKVINAGATTTVNFNLLPVSTINTIKGLSDGTNTAVSGVVTAQFPINGAQDRIYIQDTNRISGIAVATTTPLALADLVQAQGAMATTDGERILNATSVTTTQSGAALPKVFGIGNLWMGGGQYKLQPPVLNNNSQNDYAKGLSNVGLLAHAWGKVTFIDPDGMFFYMDDGSKLDDGSGHNGIRVGSINLPLPASGVYVDVVGVSGATTLNGKVVRLLRPRSIADLSYAAGVNYLQNPGFEIGMMSNWTTYGSVDGMQSGSWYGGITPHSGTYFIGSAANWGTKNGGVYQRIAAGSGSKYQARAWSRVFWSGNSPDSVQNRVGIDPTGGTDPASASVVWSPTDTQPRSDYSAWVELVTPTVTCSSSYVTIFLDGKQTNSPGWHVNCFDDAAIYRITN